MKDDDLRGDMESDMFIGYDGTAPATNMYLVLVTQTGGKYGEFECEICGQTVVYKFSAGCGNCDTCGSEWFAVVDTIDIYAGDDPCASDHWMTLECQDNSDLRYLKVAGRRILS